MKKNTHDTLEDLLQFLDDSPTAWHAVDNLRQRLTAAGFEELEEKDAWRLKPNKEYFVVRNGSSLFAFKTPKGLLETARVVASHTDSPCLKLKPKGEFRKSNMLLLDVEVYGAPLLTSWLNRDLGIAGRVTFQKKSKDILEALVNIHTHPLTIPQLAIHLDRKVNEEGLTLNKQEHLAALAALIDEEDDTPYLETLLKKSVPFQQLLAMDLFLYPLEKARFLGQDKKMIASWRLDSLGSVHAGITAFLKQKAISSTQMPIFVVWNHEEIGSSTASGAGSPFFSDTLERICLSLGVNREGFLRLLSQSLCLSVDLSHALHPNYPQKHDPRHQPLLSRGITLKTNAQMRYATEARSAAFILALAEKLRLPIQHFVSRSDIPSGSTIGPIHATLTGMPTVDLGYAQLSMHSIRELAASQDHLDLCLLLQHAFE